jgi:hypothetical protein
VGETFVVALDKSFRILEIHTEVATEMFDAGFNGVFVVAPLREG